MTDFDDIRDRVDELEERAEVTPSEAHVSEYGMFLYNDAGEILAINAGADGWDYSVSDEDFDRDENGNPIIADFTDTST